MGSGRPILSAVLTCLIVVLCGEICFGNTLPEGKPGVGDTAPTFTAEDLRGNAIALEDLVLRNRLVLLNFWGLRCGACIEEVPYLNALHDKYRGRGLVVLGVNVDGIKANQVRELMPKMPNVPTYTVIADPDFKIPDLYNLAGAPLTLVVGKDRKVLYRHEDFKPGDERELEEVLKKAVPGGQ